ncbi:MAG: phosphodiesterase YaeI [Acidobacteriota bacterium]|nr:phosphodiesterase YaeI [Acidobacteriota bacterium]
MTRRKLLLSLPIAAAAPAYVMGVEPQWLERTLTKVKLPGSAGGAFRILHLSDLHVSNFVPLSLVEKAVELGLAAKPDVICLTGDFITNRYAFDLERYSRTLRRLSAAAPTFASLGNHDGGTWVAEHYGFSDTSVVRGLLTASNVRLLHNDSEVILAGGREVRFAGVGDLWANEIDGTRAFATALPLPVILLSHNPDSKDVLGQYPWDLMLCGHTHGGQVLVPGMGPRFAPVYDKRFVAGLKGWQGRQIFVTRGVGNLGGVRLNCRPEVTLLDVQC